MNRAVKKALDKMTIPMLYDANQDSIKQHNTFEREINKIKKRQKEIEEIIDYIPDVIERKAKEKIK